MIDFLSKVIGSRAFLFWEISDCWSISLLFIDLFRFYISSCFTFGKFVSRVLSISSMLSKCTTIHSNLLKFLFISGALGVTSLFSFLNSIIQVFLPFFLMHLAKELSLLLTVQEQTFGLVDFLYYFYVLYLTYLCSYVFFFLHTSFRFSFFF